MNTTTITVTHAGEAPRTFELLVEQPTDQISLRLMRVLRPHRRAGHAFDIDRTPGEVTITAPVEALVDEVGEALRLAFEDRRA